MEQLEIETVRRLACRPPRPARQHLYAGRRGPLPTRDGRLQRLLAELAALAAREADDSPSTGERPTW